ncbi:mevalonate kinase [Streptococcus cuniculipharyngis]|uniref:Mevalonate kinase n=1 Tax=Streptococcus cuniculipharyngis TaxID=1562651 RepID=A0A5C5SFI1_9STRE|nr:mevalonate kinase [Streptococcus cuniculipharyngis]TWS98755.1 mevalonate kinase [Streptococcus cuniculipharyngis]
MKEVLGVGQAHSKIILMGEHAVVYGYPALALPLADIRVTCQVKAGQPKTHQTDDTLAHAINLAKNHLGQAAYPLSYTIESQVPRQRGMGSSAAVSLAAIRAVFDYFDADLADDLLRDLANQAERVAHSNPSGLDVRTCMSNQAIKYIRNKGFEPLHLNLGAYLVIADTGIHGQTKEAVQKIADLGQQAEQLLADLGQLTLAAEEAIAQKDLSSLGQGMTQAHYKLAELGVSCLEADTLVATALEAGALGAKMSGGGLGGCIIALVANPQQVADISQLLKEKGAQQTWIREL